MLAQYSDILDDLATKWQVIVELRQRILAESGNRRLNKTKFADYYNRVNRLKQLVNKKL